MFEANEKSTITYDVEDLSTLNVKMILGGIKTKNITMKNQEFLKLFIDGSYSSNVVGAPELPQFNQLIEIPGNAEVRVEIIKQNSVLYNLEESFLDKKIYPSQPSMPKTYSDNNIGFIYNHEIYNTDQYTNQNIIEVIKKGKLREVEIGNLFIMPIQYNPKENQLLGNQNNRKLDPNRFTITATDDTIGKELLKDIRFFDEID